MRDLIDTVESRRLRRLRRTPALRAMRRETRVHPAELVEPIFVVEREEDAGPVESMPGVERHAIAALPGVVEAIARSGVRGVMLFGLPSEKDAEGSGAYTEDGVAPRAVARIKEAVPGLAVLTDVCLCQYTDHGHCGLVDGARILNDETLDLLGRTAVAHARAGADVVAPSAMMDGQVRSIRGALDDAGFEEVAILSYAVKYASAFYGPFRDAAQSCPSFGDRRSHQMDPANVREAIAEARADAEEGADMLMVKPALAYLDVVRAVRDAVPELPVAAYQVSGEYAMVKAAAARGWLDERAVALESLTAIKRAGADMIISYWASRAAQWLGEEGG